MNGVQVAAMLKLQDAMNARVNPDWLKAGAPFLRAVIVEGGEAMEHHGWKWWKKQDTDMPQLRIELVDIWHFILSATIVHEGGNHSQATDSIVSALDGEFTADGVAFDSQFYTFKDMDLLTKLELTVGLAVSRRVSYPLFMSMLKDVGMSSDELFRQYVGKNVLNFFRQDHGYKAGTYIKVWEGREDNVWLAEFMESITPGPTFERELYMALKNKYDNLDLNQ